MSSQINELGKYSNRELIEITRELSNTYISDYSELRKIASKIFNITLSEVGVHHFYIVGNTIAIELANRLEGAIEELRYTLETMVNRS